MNNNATLYTEFKFYFNRINTQIEISHLLVLHILLIRLLRLNVFFTIFAILIFLHKRKSCELKKWNNTQQSVSSALSRKFR